MEYAIEAGVAGTVAEVRVAAGDAVQAGDLLAVVTAGAAEPSPAAADGDRQAGGGPPGPPLPPSRRSAPTWPRSWPATPPAWTRPGPRRWPAGGGPGSAPPGRTSRTWSTPGRWSSTGPGHRRPAPPPAGRRPHRPDAGRRPGGRRRHRGGAPDGRAVLRLHGAGGTQGYQNHRKKDRLFDVIERRRLPVVFFAEGGGGRPGDTDAPGVSGLDTMAFHLWGRLSGWCPGWASPRAGASPATPPSSGRATWSSPPGAPTSAWAAPP